MARTVLTDAMVRRLRPPRENRAVHWDAALPGFGLRITVNGRRSFVLVGRLRGRPVFFTIGAYPALGLAEARDEAREVIRMLARGEDPRVKRKARAAREAAGTFGAIAREFLEKSARATATYGETKRIVEKELLPAWRDAPPSTITRTEVVAVLDAIAARNAPVMRNRTLGVIGRVFSWALNQGLVEFHPSAGLKKVREEPRERVYSEKEIRSLWGAFDSLGYPFGRIFALLLVTAQRRGEVTGLRPVDVDLDQNLWTVPRTKAGHSHEVPLSPMAVEIIRALPHINGTELFFTTTGTTSVSGFSKAVERVCILSGVTDFRPHDLRRTAGTYMARIGIPKVTISRVLNHAEGGVTDIYVRHSFLEEKRTAVEHWAMRLGEITG